jgi:hypothetical protein
MTLTTRSGASACQRNTDEDRTNAIIRPSAVFAVSIKLIHPFLVGGGSGNWSAGEVCAETEPAGQIRKPWIMSCATSRPLESKASDM